MPIILVLIFLSLSSFAQEKHLKEDLNDSLKKILRDQKQKQEDFHFALINLDDDQLISSYQAHEHIQPASVAKLLTAAYALKKLGPNFRFHTELLYTGEIKNGFIHGDLFLKGYGDPSLTMARLMDFTMELRNKGIKGIKGNFYYDESQQPSQDFLDYNFGLGDQTYNPGLGALNLEFNRLSLHKSGHKRTSKALFQALPPLPHIDLQKVSKGFSPGKRFHFNSNNPGEVWELSTRQNYKYREDIPIRRPGRYCAESMRYFSAFWNIALPAPRLGKTPKEAKLLSKDESVSLLELLSKTLEYSNNLFAEQILIRASKKKSLKMAAEDFNQWLKSILPNSQFKMHNGSGLSSKNLLRPVDLAQFIDQYALKGIGGRGFMSLFSISGQSGWIRNRLFDPNLAFRVWAKTGSLDYVNNMAGVIFTNTGKRIAFSLSLIDKQKRALLDGDNNSKVNRVRKRAKAWKNHTTRTQDKILTHWINTL